ncbi:hypothetical protein M3Y99_01123200 [Aphelenchoides fujianensis]|nr:hypothetical protein M3Y99_01123200 [Aphelenchoides fujianensis]
MQRLTAGFCLAVRLRSAALNPTATSRTLAAVAGITPTSSGKKPGLSNAVLFGQDNAVVQKMKASASSSKGDIPEVVQQEVFEDVQVVYTTGFKGKYGGGTEGRIGVFWETGDSDNIYKEIPSDEKSGPSLAVLAFESVLTALRQARHDKNLTRVMIKTDSEYVAKCARTYLKTWRQNGYLKKDGTPVKNREYLEELDRLMSSIDAKIVFEKLQEPTYNRVVELLKTDKGISPKIGEDEKQAEPELKIEAAPSSKNVVYTTGVLKTNDDGFVLSAYGVHWPQQKELDTCGRFGDFPLTHFRAQLSAIITAIETAIENELADVHVVTDSDRFLRFYRRDWTKKDGTPMANAPLYRKIKQLEEQIKVTYAYNPPDHNDQIAQAAVLAEDGLAYPTKTQRIHQEKRKEKAAKAKSKKAAKKKAEETED